LFSVAIRELMELAQVGWNVRV